MLPAAYRAMTGDDAHLAAAVALCAAGFLSIWAVERIGDAVRARRERR